MSGGGLVRVGGIDYASGAANKEVKLNSLDPEREIRRIRLLPRVSIIGAAAGFAVQAADHYKLVAAIIALIKGSWDFEDNALQLAPHLLRQLSLDSQGADPLVEDLRVGDAINASGGAAIVVNLPIDIDFTHQGLETPNMFCPSSDQFNASGAKLNVDLGTLATGGGNVVLGGGTAVVQVQAIDVLVELADAFGRYVGPHWVLRQYGENRERDDNMEPGVELFLAQQSDPTTFETVFSQVLMNVDNVNAHRQVTPRQLGLDYLRTAVRRDALRSYDLTRNALMAGAVGGQLSPVRWVKGSVRAAEFELPFQRRQRSLEFTRTNNPAAFLFLQSQVKHIAHSKTLETMRRVMVDAKVTKAPKDLEVRGFGGADNNLLDFVKGRWISKRPV